MLSFSDYRKLQESIAAAPVPVLGIAPVQSILTTNQDLVEPVQVAGEEDLDEAKKAKKKMFGDVAPKPEDKEKPSDVAPEESEDDDMDDDDDDDESEDDEDMEGEDKETCMMKKSMKKCNKMMKKKMKKEQSEWWASLNRQINAKGPERRSSDDYLTDIPVMKFN